MPIQEFENGKIVARYKRSIRELKEEFYDFVDSSADFLDAREYRKMTSLPVTVFAVGANKKVDHGFECDAIMVIVDGDCFGDDMDLSRYFIRHEAAEIWTILKPGHTVEKKSSFAKSSLDDVLDLAHKIGSRESFRLAVREGKGKRFMDFMEQKIKLSLGGKVDESELQKRIKVQRDAYEKARDEKRRGVLK